MSGDYRETYPIEEQKIANTLERKLFQTPDIPLFHYTSREVFWKIIEEESFLARHILFSNDSEEYELGRSKVKTLKVDGTADQDGGEEGTTNERYMICFCEKGDLLSQWRGYAKNGIAMEFDFSLGIGGNEENSFSPYHCFTLTNGGDVPVRSKIGAYADSEDKRQENFERRYVSVDERTGKKYLTLCITAPYKVFYATREKNTQELRRALKSIKEREAAGISAAKLIPYIKNKKFDEEKEYRLIFDLEDLYNAEQEHMRGGKNIYLDMDGVKKPNIRIEFGDVRDSLEKDTIEIYYADLAYQDALEDFVKALEKEKIKVAQKLMPDGTKLRKNELLLGNGKNQERVMWRLSQMLNVNRGIFKNVKVWCDGHLPLRQIIVAPGKDAELMRKSILQYKNNKYWMKYIDVKVSEIPYRD
ncbi:MAG: DUF2971 domain-containing protein [Lachnospiraceae bacterium]|nr:DUF2971 domain-containing protein [Lachnospiraceae bacterium]